MAKILSKKYWLEKILEDDKRIEKIEKAVAKKDAKELERLDRQFEKELKKDWIAEKREKIRKGDWL